jgi:hypothetical protein
VRTVFAIDQSYVAMVRVGCFRQFENAVEFVCLLEEGVKTGGVVWYDVGMFGKGGREPGMSKQKWRPELIGSGSRHRTVRLQRCHVNAKERVPRGCRLHRPYQRFILTGPLVTRTHRCRWLQIGAFTACVFANSQPLPFSPLLIPVRNNQLHRLHLSTTTASLLHTHPKTTKPTRPTCLLRVLPRRVLPALKKTLSSSSQSLSNSRAL